MAELRLVNFYTGEKCVFATEVEYGFGCLRYGETLDTLEALDAACRVFEEEYHADQYRKPRKGIPSLRDITALAFEKGDGGFEMYSQSKYDDLAARGAAYSRAVYTADPPKSKP